MALVTVACQPTRVVIEVTNDSAETVDFIYAEDFIDLSDFGRDYDALSVGDVDTYQGCTECPVAPGEMFIFDIPLARGQSVVMAARESDTERLIFIQRYSFTELRDKDWIVRLSDQR